MWPFKPKYKRIEDQEGKDGAEPDAQAAPQDAQVQVSGDAATQKLSAEITRLKAQFDQFAELRKVFNERFTRINEQVGELRGMIMDSNRSMQDIEVKTVKAVDLVDAVQPDKLMVEVRKQDAKVEALKASLESNEAMMKSIMSQLKDLRQNVSKFRGIEQMVKLSEDVKKELMNIKKVEATVERHSDKVEGIFLESQKRFQDFETIQGKIGDIAKQVETSLQQSDQNKVKITATATKKDVENLINKFNDFEKHVGNVIDLVSKQANDLPKDLDDRFKYLEKSMNKAFDIRLRRAQRMNRLIVELEKRAPKIAAELRMNEIPKDEVKTGEDGKPVPGSGPISAGESSVKAGAAKPGAEGQEGEGGEGGKKGGLLGGLMGKKPKEEKKEE